MKERTLTIRVTEQHIRDGKRGHSDDCPVALAAIAAGLILPRVRYVNPSFLPSVGGWMNETWVEFPANRAIATFMMRFDDGETVAPFETTLREVSS